MADDRDPFHLHDLLDSANFMLELSKDTPFYPPKVHAQLVVCAAAKIPVVFLYDKVLDESDIGGEITPLPAGTFDKLPEAYYLTYKTTDPGDDTDWYERVLRAQEELRKEIEETPGDPKKIREEVRNALPVGYGEWKVAESYTNKYGVDDLDGRRAPFPLFSSAMRSYENLRCLSVIPEDYFAPVTFLHCQHCKVRRFSSIAWQNPTCLQFVGDRGFCSPRCEVRGSDRPFRPFFDCREGRRLCYQTVRLRSQMRSLVNTEQPLSLKNACALVARKWSLKTDVLPQELNDLLRDLARLEPRPIDNYKLEQVWGWDHDEGPRGTMGNSMSVYCLSCLTVEDRVVCCAFLQMCGGFDVDIKVLTPKEHFWTVVWVFTPPRYRGMGFAKNIISEVARLARGDDMKSLLAKWDGGIAGERFLLSCGFSRRTDTPVPLYELPL